MVLSLNIWPRFVLEILNCLWFIQIETTQLRLNFGMMTDCCRGDKESVVIFLGYLQTRTFWGVRVVEFLFSLDFFFSIFDGWLFDQEGIPWSQKSPAQEYPFSLDCQTWTQGINAREKRKGFNLVCLPYWNHSLHFKMGEDIKMVILKLGDVGEKI